MGFQAIACAPPQGSHCKNCKASKVTQEAACELGRTGAGPFRGGWPAAATLGLAVPRPDAAAISPALCAASSCCCWNTCILQPRNRASANPAHPANKMFAIQTSRSRNPSTMKSGGGSGYACPPCKTCRHSLFCRLGELYAWRCFGAGYVSASTRRRCALRGHVLIRRRSGPHAVGLGLRLLLALQLLLALVELLLLPQRVPHILQHLRHSRLSRMRSCRMPPKGASLKRKEAGSTLNRHVVITLLET